MTYSKSDEREDMIESILIVVLMFSGLSSIASGFFFTVELTIRYPNHHVLGGALVVSLLVFATTSFAYMRLFYDG